MATQIYRNQPRGTESWGSSIRNFFTGAGDRPKYEVMIIHTHEGKSIINVEKDYKIAKRVFSVAFAALRIIVNAGLGAKHAIQSFFSSTSASARHWENAKQDSRNLIRACANLPILTSLLILAYDRYEINKEIEMVKMRG